MSGTRIQKETLLKYAKPSTHFHKERLGSKGSRGNKWARHTRICPGPKALFWVLLFLLFAPPCPPFDSARSRGWGPLWREEPFRTHPVSYLIWQLGQKWVRLPGGTKTLSQKSQHPWINPSPSKTQSIRAQGAHGFIGKRFPSQKFSQSGLTRMTFRIRIMIQVS